MNWFKKNKKEKITLPEEIDDFSIIYTYIRNLDGCCNYSSDYGGMDLGGNGSVVMGYITSLEYEIRLINGELTFKEYDLYLRQNTSLSDMKLINVKEAYQKYLKVI